MEKSGPALLESIRDKDPSAAGRTHNGVCVKFAPHQDLWRCFCFVFAFNTLPGDFILVSCMRYETNTKNVETKKLVCVLLSAPFPGAIKLRAFAMMFYFNQCNENLAANVIGIQQDCHRTGPDCQCFCPLSKEIYLE
jgi:hypothetical protein